MHLNRMKAFSALFLCLAAALPCQAGDIRMINGRAVDLQPIHDWRAEKGTLETRPLKHWKELRVVALQQSISESMHVAKVLIDGSPQIITLKNMPKELVTKLNRLQTLKGQVAKAQHNTDVANANAKAAQMRVPKGYTVSGTQEFVAAILIDEERKANQAAAATATAEVASANLATMHQEVVALAADIGETSILAMATGGSYAGKPLWDTGLK
jgi:hypothetical protein